MHLCRGNFRSSWIAQGGYEPVADLLFNALGIDVYFMEYDTERAGGFEPLRFFRLLSRLPESSEQFAWLNRTHREL